ncbi:putative PAS/PAC sensor protein [Methanohalobium evestigatum Z-7303]|uniref:Putative PAS/PAC sensor protein n=1 Tax=Methanohalobium evestigatum (strain ATCC BAA-1072 / DSM 3721 / NBRC 107634 / OCM 161 / Z-7303) TaxID=644295 RepID=D7E6S5_METEZ|nr:PAS domain S-box protein [Methanohalobium evestigatum]ADI73297.1 putative PAS/PAC sensor protein [Methanohalobium evestigatum Z-7303]
MQNYSELLSTTELLNSVFESIKEGVCLHEIIYDSNNNPVDYRIIDTNPAYESIIGLKREDVSGKKASDIYGTIEPPYLHLYAKTAETGEKAYFETFFPPLNKHFSISVISPGRGMFITIFTDITGQKNIDKELEAIYENSPVVSMVVDSDRRIIKMNKSAEQFAGAISDEVKGMKGGDALRCLHSLDDPDGCGFGPHCK